MLGLWGWMGMMVQGCAGPWLAGAVPSCCDWLVAGCGLEPLWTSPHPSQNRIRPTGCLSQSPMAQLPCRVWGTQAGASSAASQVAPGALPAGEGTWLCVAKWLLAFLPQLPMDKPEDAVAVARGLQRAPHGRAGGRAAGKRRGDGAAAARGWGGGRCYFRSPHPLSVSKNRWWIPGKRFRCVTISSECARRPARLRP